MSKDCNSLLGLLIGHKFRPRYSVGNPTITSLSGGNPRLVADVIEASKPETYVCDVCERCGLLARPATNNKEAA